MLRSPFQQSLPNEFHAAIGSLDFLRALETAQADSFSDASLVEQHPVRAVYESEVVQRTARMGTLISEGLQSELAQDRAAAHLKVKLLSEHALAHLQTNDKLLGLSDLKELEKRLKALTGLRDEIVAQLESSALVLRQQTQRGQVDAATVEHHESLVNKLLEVDDQREQIDSAISSQHILALFLTNFDDMALPPSQQADDRQTDELISYVASIAVQLNVALPPPQADGSKSEWARSCVDSLLASSSAAPAVKNEAEPEVAKLKTALQDLQFAHQYLTKQYGDERSLNSEIMDSYKKKSLSLENKLSESSIQLERATQRTILVEHEKNVLLEKYEGVTRTLHDLKREMALIRIDNIGPDSAMSSPSRHHQVSPSSPVTGLTMPLEQESNPKTPLMQQTRSSHLPSPPSPPRFSSSISVLRKEFKKMVVDLHNEYENELEKEKSERMRLQHLLRLYEERE